MYQYLRYVIYLISILLISSGNIFSQINDSVKWDIQDCFRYALEHNFQINTLRLNERIALQELKLAHGAKIPTLYANVSNSWNNSNNDPAGSGVLVNQLNISGNYAVN